MTACDCPRCTRQNGRFDRYCYHCGAPLADPRWKLLGDRVADGDGHLVIGQLVPSAVARIANRGTGAMSLVLAEPGALPDWIARLPREPVHVEPGGEGSVEIGLDVARLQRLFEPAAHRDDAAADVSLDFLSTLMARDGDGLSPRRLTLRIVIAREPRLSPAASLYPFLPWERADGLVHAIEIHNDAAERIEVRRVEILDDPSAQALGGPRLGARSLLEPVEALPAQAQPGATIALGLRFVPPEERTDGWFAAVVRYHYLLGREEERSVQATITGVLGTAPDLVFEDGQSRRTLALPEVPTAPREVILRNPGSIPVNLRDVEVLRGGAVVTGDDWLAVEGVPPGRRIAPGQTLKLQLTIRPDDRDDEEAKTALCERRVRIRHDGGTGDGAAELLVKVGFPPTLIASSVWLGVDFGTSNSMVCALRNEHSTPLFLEGDSVQLPSLMYFTGGGGKKRADDAFLLGQKAKASERANPTNLVRSIKSVVARAPDTRFDFVLGTSQGGYQYHHYTTQQLLDLLIKAMRRQAESGVPRLPDALIKDLFQGRRHVRFRRAVFTHPVDINEPMKKALHGAARSARLVGHAATLEAFSSDACVDEATAAVLAYVYLRAYEKLKKELPFIDSERVLCYDVGGGTTDVAAVEVNGLRAYRAGEAESVSVVLCATAGDARSGGDNLDRWLALRALDQVRQQAEDARRPIDVRPYIQAIEADSWPDFKLSFQPPPGAEPDADYKVHRKAEELRSEAEKAKRKLGTSTSETFPPVDGADWLRAKAAGPEGQFKVTLDQRSFAEHVTADTTQRCRLLDQVLQNARWSWDQVTTLLFTGQGTRVPFLRKAVLDYVRSKRGEALPIVIQPDDGTGFDPKACVALGAAVRGSSRESEWLVVTARKDDELTFDVQRRFGPKWKTIPGLEAGRALPASAEVGFGTEVTELVLGKNGAEYVRFEWSVPCRSVRVEVRGDASYVATVQDKEIQGVLV